MSQTFGVPPVWDTAGNYTNNPIYTVGETLNIKWSTNNDQYQVYMWQQSLTQGSAAVSNPIFIKALGSSESRGFAWKVDPLNFDLSLSNVFFMALGPNNTLQGSFLSHYFNLTEKSTQTTSSTTSATYTSSTTRSVATTTSPSSATSTTAASTLMPSSGSETNGSMTNIGLILGLALGLGIPIILLLGFLAIKVSRKKPMHIAPSPGGIQVVHSQSGEPPLWTRDQKHVYAPQAVKVDQELDGRQYFATESKYNRPYHGDRPAELPSDRGYSD